MSKASDVLQAIHEMANLRPHDTGIKGVTIWIHPETGKEKHNAPRMKVKAAVDGKPPMDFSMGFDGTVYSGKNTLKTKQMQSLLKYIELNIDLLTKLWAGEISHEDYKKSHTKLES